MKPIYRSNLWPNRILSFVFVSFPFMIFLLLAALLCGYLAWGTLQFQKIGRPVTGVVTRWVHHSSVRGGYEVVEVRYQTPDGKVRTQESANHSLFNFNSPKVGERVDLLYNPNDPTVFRLAQSSQMWSGPIFCFVITIFVSLGFAIRILYS